LPRGIALDITVDNSATISAVTPISTDYWVYPGSFDINDTNFPSGTPVGESSTGSITVEMGTLHSPADVNSGPALGNIDLLSFEVSGDCNVTIAGNALRGKVVNYKAQAATATYTGCKVVDYDGCLPLGHADWTEWDNLGRPTSWCYPKQCHGDATGSDQQFGRGNWVSVGSADVTVLLSGYNDNTYVDEATDPWIAADFTHSAQQFGRGNWVRVGSADVTILLSYYNDNESTVPADCLD
jgi:hypothetical protein